MRQATPSGDRSLAFRLLAVLAALALLATACGTDDDAEPDPAEDDTGVGEQDDDDPPDDEVAGDDQHGGVVVQAIGAEPETLNMAISTNYPGGAVGAAVFEGLVWVDHDFEPHPSLAESWDISDDGLTYTFHLRQGVTFHDGEPLTSADVRFTYEEMLATTHPRMQATLTRLESIETPDDHTVVINLTEPFGPFMLQQTVMDAPILPMHLYEGTDVGDNPHNDAPIGTGPFRFESWDRGSSLRLVRYEDYWDGDKPYLDELVFQVIPDGVNRSTGLETGEIDFVPSFYMPQPDVERLRGLDAVEVVETTGTPALWLLHLNVESEVFSSVEARQAVAHLVDRERIVEQAMAGLARPGAGAFGQGFDWVYDPSVGYDALYEQDADAARELLDQAGVAEGTQVRLVYDNARADVGAAAEIVRENLAAAGLEVALEPQEQSLMTDSVFVNRDFDLTIQSYISNNDPAIGYHRIYRTTDPGVIFTNPTNYSNAEVDELLEDAGSELDFDRRAEIYAELQDILNRELPALALYDWIQVDGMAAGLGGVGLSHETRDRWGEVYWDG